ncbi:ketopantoate reductase PanE/ApbA C terminal-domain-containing protein [Stachybotrys elegans]|uniref:Ketopantoate reductase PanE/ApbA C terminal-domain-containing protein n=1 Tax=Stachybotrys elegans TaxID=80388 RepID=A0A8K0SLL8_9HYPO|nr:ketopantoate reductase PanE/ApbA C terminal-domain-containing protein [Stachybotrys elegans]
MAERASYSTVSRTPPWLEPILHDHSPPRKLFAWRPDNVASGFNHPPSRADDRRIYILGAGNLGRLFASLLQKHPEPSPVTLVVHRKDALSDWISSNGIEILRSGVLDANKNFDIEWWTDKPPEQGPVREVADGGKLRNLIIATKAGNALEQVDRARGYLDRNSTIAFVQNGMSKMWPPHGLTFVDHRYPSNGAPSFLACVTTHGVTSQGPFKSLHASQGNVRFGPVLVNSASWDSANHLTRQLSTTPQLDATLVSRQDLWVLQLEKLVVNSIINPLTAILRCKNGELFTTENEAARKIMDLLLQEASGVLQALVWHESTSEALGLTPEQETTMDEAPSGGATSVRESLWARFTVEQLRDMLYAVGYKVRDNTSSMLQDVNAGRSTEIRDFNGWLVETAAFVDPQLGVSANRKLIDLVERGASMNAAELQAHLCT